MNLKIKVKQGKVLQLFLKGNVPIRYVQVLAKIKYKQKTPHTYRGARVPIFPGAENMVKERLVMREA